VDGAGVQPRDHARQVPSSSKGVVTSSSPDPTSSGRTEPPPAAGPLVEPLSSTRRLTELTEPPFSPRFLRTSGVVSGRGRFRRFRRDGFCQLCQVSGRITGLRAWGAHLARLWARPPIHRLPKLPGHLRPLRRRRWCGNGRGWTAGAVDDEGLVQLGEPAAVDQHGDGFAGLAAGEPLTLSTV
jgi:hypothetical protein